MGPHIGVNLVHLVRVDRFVSDGVTACPVADTRRVRLEDMRYVLVSENHSGPVTASPARRSLSRARQGASRAAPLARLRQPGRAGRAAPRVMARKAVSWHPPPEARLADASLGERRQRQSRLALAGTGRRLSSPSPARHRRGSTRACPAQSYCACVCVRACVRACTYQRVAFGRECSP